MLAFVNATRDGFALPYMNVESIDEAKACHASFRVLELCELDSETTREGPSDYALRFGERGAVKYGRSATDTWLRVVKSYGRV